MLSLNDLTMGEELHRRFAEATVEHEARCIHCAISNDGTLARRAKVASRPMGNGWLILPTAAEQAKAYAQCRLIAAVPALADAFAEKYGKRPILLAANTFIWQHALPDDDALWVLTAQRLEWSARWYAGDRRDDAPPERSLEAAKALVSYHQLVNGGEWLAWFRTKAARPGAVGQKPSRPLRDVAEEAPSTGQLINWLGTPTGRLQLRQETGADWQLTLTRRGAHTHLEPVLL